MRAYQQNDDPEAPSSAVKQAGIESKYMRAITVAIADDDGGRRAKYENSLQGAEGIRVLTYAAISAGDITKIRQLNPRVLLVSMKQCADCAMLDALRRECPETRVILFTDESFPQEDQLMHALAKGVRGYLSLEAGMAQISKAVHLIDSGDAWVPRRVLGNILDQILHQRYQTSSSFR